MSAQRPSFKPNRNSKSFLNNLDGSIGSGILSGIVSPAFSAGGRSTTVTPLIPMTPLTTPLDILLGRHNFGAESGGLFRPSPSILQLQSSLIDEDEHHREKQVLLHLFENVLTTAETTINEITERESSGHPVLGEGIARLCRDLANEIEGMAKGFHREHLEQASNENELIFIDEGDSVGGNEEKSTNKAASALSALATSEITSSFQSHEDFITNFSTAHTLMLDMAAALRAITHQEAQELGEVALEVARMFVWSLGMVHSKITTESVDHRHSMDERQKGGDKSTKNATENDNNKKQPRVTWSQDQHTNSRELGPEVEAFKDEEKEDEYYVVTHPPPGSPTTFTAELRCKLRLSPIPSSPPKELSSPTTIANSFGCSRHGSGDRVRILWPPILPAITKASTRAVRNAKEHPIPAIVIGLTCGPAVIATAAISGPPLFVADWAIQQTYHNAKDSAVIEYVEKGAANALQVARLAILSSKLVVKQGTTVGKRQIERRGGMGNVCSDVVGGAVNMALHPIDTAGMVWKGLFWVGGATRGAMELVKDMSGRGDPRTDIHL